MNSSFLKKCFKARFMLAALCGLSFASHLDAIRTADELARFEKQVQREMTHPTAHLKNVLATYKALRHAHLEAGGQGAEARMRQMIDNMRTAIRAAKTQGSPHLQRSLRGMNPFTGHQVTIHIARPATPPIGHHVETAHPELRTAHTNLQHAYNTLDAEHNALRDQHGALQNAHQRLQRENEALRAQLAAGHGPPQGQPPAYHQVFPQRPQQVPAAHPASHHSGLLGAGGHGLLPTYNQVAGHIPPAPPPPPHLLGQGGHGLPPAPHPAPAAGGHGQPAAHIGGMLNQIQQAGAAMHQHHATEHAAGHHIGPQPGQRPAHGNIQQQMMNHPMFQAVTAANQDDENEDDDPDW